MINIGDVQFFMKKNKNVENTGNFPRTKGYSRNIGGLFLNGSMAVGAFVVAAAYFIDFFAKNIKVDRPDKRRNNNMTNN